MEPTAHVPLPEIAFRDGTPVSCQFGDVYFSRAGGIAETGHVFLRGNALPERFAEAPRFTIGELGFGTGLNFLVAWDAFLRHAPQHHHLHFLTVEKFPLTPSMLAEALALQPELAPLADQLVAQYPLRLPGLHRIHFPRVTLTLGFGDAADLLPEFAATGTRVDAWFLDGFAPAKNPEMWNDTLLHSIGRLSAPGATFATFTSAGVVRRGLAAQGFTVEKIPGYGHKREMSIGRLPGTAASTAPAAAPSVLVIGAGIAGATAAHALATRGCRVTVLERDSIASGASGNAAAVLFPQLSKRWTPAAAWYFAGYSFMLHQLARWRSSGIAFPHDRPGMLRLPRHEAEETQLRNANAVLGLDPAIAHWVERDEASAQAGVSLPTGATCYPHGSWLDPAALCAALLQHPNITLHTQAEVTALTRTNTGWCADTATGSYDAAHCLLATAADTARFTPLTLNRVAGQVSILPAGAVAAPLRSILCYKGYVIPAGNMHLIGATYEHGDLSCRVTDDAHARNLDDIAPILPRWAVGAPQHGRTSIRATTPDRLPYIGALEPGLWVSAGHGSRGMLSAPLAAELIAAQLMGEAPPVTAALAQAGRPGRFMKA